MMRKILLALVLAVALAGGISYAGEVVSEQAISYYNEAVQAQKDRNYQAAATLYQKALLLNPGKDILKQVLNNYGAMQAKAENYAAAEDLFKRALTMDMHYRPAALNLGLIFDKQQDKLKSMTFWLLAFRIDLDAMKPKTFVVISLPDFRGKSVLYSDQQDQVSQAALLNAKAVMYIQQGEMKKAEAELNNALKLCPDFTSAKMNLGLIYDQREDKVAAMEYWLKAFKIELDSRKPKDYILEGTLEEKIK